MEDKARMPVEPAHPGVLVRGVIAKRRLKRGVFRSIVDLQAAINRFLKEINNHPKLRVDRRS